MTDMTREEWAMRDKAYQRKAVLESCEKALKTMENFIEAVRRDIKSAAADDEALLKLPIQLSHQLAWGQANVLSILTSAQSSVIRYQEAGQ